MLFRQYHNRPRLPTWALLSLLCTPAAQAALQARLDQNPVYVGDTLTLSLSSDAAGNGAEPDLAPLKRDFEVLGTSTSTQLSLINGRGSTLTEWRVQLLPRRSGELSVPALQLGAERSQPLPVKVTDAPAASSSAAAASAGHLFVEASLDPAAGTPYVQQQIPYRVRLYYDDTLREGALADPQIADAVVERVGEDAHGSAVRNGRRYQVTERLYAVFPQKSGMLEIPPARFEGRMAGADGGRRTGSRGDGLMQRFLQNTPFANAPFFQGNGFSDDLFGGIFGDAGQPVRAFGPGLKVDVRPPAAGPGAWLPAGAVRLHDSWTDAPPQLRAGEPVSRTITIEADDASGSQIPALDLAAKTLRIYPEPVENTTRNDAGRLLGSSRQTFTYIPDAAGSLNVPPVSLAWWNTRKDAAASAELPAWQLSVAAGAGGPAAEPAPPAAPAPATTPAAASVAVAATPQAASRGMPSYKRAGFTAAAVLLAAVLLWWLLRPKRPAPQPGRETMTGAPPVSNPARSNAERGRLFRTLEAACRERDGMAAARALLALAAMQWPSDPVYNLNDLAARLDQGADSIRALDRHLYGAAGQAWPADALWDALRRGLRLKTPEPAKHGADELPPLYPNPA